MEFNQIETRIEEAKHYENSFAENDLDLMSISLEAEVPEALYLGMKSFIYVGLLTTEVEHIPFKHFSHLKTLTSVKL